ncbi:NADP-dependent oxidoreductase [Streptomyces sp. NPDC088725]|uniref:NADP-dependent oxidoreductase n=1 Tax=Streptomyces sp. NPDC088725 TaxID=3365873 RepID=UPI0038169B5F
MQAVVFDEFGAADVLHLTDIEEPHPGPGQVRVVVRAAGVNPLDTKIRHGWMEEVFPTPLPAVPGIELAGIIDEIGEGVTDLTVGDEVLGWSTTGAYAQYSLAEVVVQKPENLEWAEATALPTAGETSLRVLELLGLREGETLLLHGAAGVVGAVATQLAVARGVTVIGTASEVNHDYLRSLGAIPVTYGTGLVARVRAAAPQGVDAVFDAAGQGALPDSIELRGGTTDRVVTIADMSAPQLGVTFTSGAPTPEVRRKRLAESLGFVRDGTLKLRVAGTFSLAEAAKAQETSEAGHAPGKLVILV